MDTEYLLMPLVIESLEDNNTISINFILGTTEVYINYSLDGEESYEEKTLYGSSTLVTLNEGDTLYIDDVEVEGYRKLLDCGFTFNTTGKINIYGNMNNVISSYNVKDGTYNNIAPFWFWHSNVVDASNLSMGTSFGDYAYYMFLADSKYLTSPPELPATNLTKLCYGKMFYWCTSLDTMPNLPATTLAPYCYYGMFRSCDGMLTVPKLPATQLAEGCYFGMFADCDKIRNIINIAAKELDKNCYRYMFYNCGTVNDIHARMTETPDKVNTYNWTLGVKDRGVFTLNSHATWEKYGPHYIPYDWSLNYDGNTDYGNMPLTIETEGKIGMGAQIGVKFNQDTTYVELDIIYNEGEDDEDEQTIQLTSSNYNIIELPNFHDRLSIKSITVISEKFDIDEFDEGFSFTSTKPINIMGNIRNTTISYEFEDETYTHTLPYLFSGAPVLNANHLMLDYDIDPYCYTHMFDGCIELQSAPYLSASTLTEGCYQGMFYECVKMKYSPVLIATTAKRYCYKDMFKKCSALLYPPELPATTLAVGCYESMFSGCTSLLQAIPLAATTAANSCYQRMFEGCTSLTTPPALPATTLAVDCYSYMFANCTGLLSFSALPALTAAIRCYDHMFYNCRNVKYHDYITATTLAQDCFRSMFSGCSSLLDTPQLINTTLANGCYANMFEGCTSLTTPPTLPATTLAVGCYNAMFKGCTSLLTAPVLNASSLTTNCYPNMFNGCKEIDYIEAMFYDKPSTTYTTDWLKNVANTGTFVKPIDAYWNVRSATGIPKGWNIQYTGTLDYSNTYLIIESLEDDNVIEFGMYEANEYYQQYAKQISYSFDGTNWETVYSIDWNEQDLRSKIGTLHKGDRVLFKGTEDTYTTDDVVSKIFASKKYKVYGNIMSLFYGDNFVGQTAFPDQTKTNNLQEFFANTPLVDASDLVLPATTLTQNVYRYMFKYCDYLTDAPVLPATTLSTYCYYGMFQHCLSLETAPELPATTLAYGCYIAMFWDCHELTTPPELPATTLSTICYSWMFFGCRSLVEAPYLPATTLVSDCYSHMFEKCYSLNRIKANFETTPDIAYMNYWVYAVASTGIFYKNEDALWDPDSYRGESGIPVGWLVSDDDDSSYPVTIIPKANGTLTVTMGSNLDTTSLEYISYSYDGTNWTNTNNVTGQEVAININATNDEKIYLKGYGKQLSSANTDSYSTVISSDFDFDVEGNIMSLLYDDYFVNTSFDTNYSYQFCRLFNNNTHLIDASDLVLPATTLTQGCYTYMFDHCSNMTYAPELPATTLAPDCYKFMLSYTKIYTAPTLAATTLASGCYADMFYSDTSLILAQITLPATTLETDCYAFMFQGCTSLTTAPNLPATTLANGCYASMFRNCTSLTTAPELPATILASNCYKEMFKNSSNITTAPVLNASVLVNGCYQEMFRGCSRLNYIKMMATDISATNALTNWVRSVAASGTFAKDSSMTSLPTGYNGIPSGWTIQNIQHDYELDYFVTEQKIEAITPTADITFTIPSGLSTSDYSYISYSTDNGLTWNTTNNVDGQTITVTVSVSNGAKVLWKGSGKTMASMTNDNQYSYFSGTAHINIKGNIMSLLNGDNFYHSTFDTNYNRQFNKLFYNNANIYDARELVLPATTLTDECYGHMFYGCHNLLTAPELPATTLATKCYRNMFDGCFNLTTAPILPATTLTDTCYWSMFADCTSLNYIKMLATDISAYSCLGGWVENVAATGTFVKDASMTTLPTGYNGIPSGWTVTDNT